jgi:hypothetical protein
MSGTKLYDPLLSVFFIPTQAMQMLHFLDTCSISVNILQFVSKFVHLNNFIDLSKNHTVLSYVLTDHFKSFFLTDKYIYIYIYTHTHIYTNIHA